MKKISILSQIVIIFITILLFSCTVFTFLSAAITRISTKEEVYSRLISYSSILSNYQPTEKYPISNNDMKVEFVIVNKIGHFKSEGFSDLINSEK